MADAPQELSTNSATLSGAVDGTNPTFTAPFSPAVNLLFRNGLLMDAPGDYRASGAAVTFTGEQTPQSGDVVTEFAYDPSLGTVGSPLNLPRRFRASDATIAGALNGSNNVFTLATSDLVTQAMVWWNGDFMTQGVDYTLACVQPSSAGQWVTTLTFMAGQFPNAGDALVAEVFGS